MDTKTKNLRNTVFARQNRSTGLWGVRVNGKFYELNHLRACTAVKEGNKIADRLMAEQVDPYATMREEGRKMGLSEAQINSIIVRTGGTL